MHRTITATHPRLTATIIAVLAILYTLTGCAVPEDPPASGTIVDLHLTGAKVAKQCDLVSVVPAVEDCHKVHVPDKCYAFLEAPDGGYVRAEVWCDTYEDLRIGQQFEDGTHVTRSTCAFKDTNGRWGTIHAADCAEYKNGLDD